MSDKLLKGSITKSILSISLPVIGANILHTIYQITDTFWVGRLGTEAVAAVSLSFPILMLTNAVAMGLSLGSAILIAQYNGKGDRENVAQTTGQTFLLVSLISIFAAILGYFISGFFVSLFTDNPLVFSQGRAYLQIAFLAMPSVFLFMTFRSFAQGIGSVILPLYITLITVIMNFFIDPIFMFGLGPIPALGVAGVAWATFLTEGLAALIGLIILVSGCLGFRLKLLHLWPKKIWLKRLFALSLPVSIETSNRSISMLLMTFLVSTLGTLPLAAYGIGVKILSLVVIPALGLSVATTSLVGNNLGAGQLNRAEKIAKKSLWIGFGSLTVLGVFTFIAANKIAEFFVPGEINLINLSSQFIRIMSFAFGLIGIHLVVIGVLKGAGKTKLTMFLAMLVSFGILLIAYILTNIFELKELGVWISYPLIDLLVLPFMIYFYLKKDWLYKKLV